MGKRPAPPECTLSVFIMSQAVHSYRGLSPSGAKAFLQNKTDPKSNQKDLARRSKHVSTLDSHYLTRSFFFDFISLCVWFCSFSYLCSQAVFPPHESLSHSPLSDFLASVFLPFFLCSLQETKVSDFASNGSLTSFQRISEHQEFFRRCFPPAHVQPS